MGVMLGAGCILIAYGPSAVFLLAYAGRRSALLVLTIASAFVWLISVLVSSIIWIAIPPLQTVHPFTAIVGVCVQELARWLIVWLYVQSESRADALQLRTARKKLGQGRSSSGHALKMFNDLSAALAAGLGFGAMHTVMMYGALLGTAVSQEAAYYVDSCPQVNAFVITAVTALFYNVLHVALMIIALDAWRRQSRPLFAIPVSLHLVFTLMTFFNLGSGGTCIASLPLQALVLVGSIVLAVRVVRAPDYAATRQLRAWTLLVQTWEDNETQHGLGNNSNGGHRGGSAVSSGVAGGAGAGSLQRRAPATQATLPQQTR